MVCRPRVVDAQSGVVVLACWAGGEHGTHTHSRDSFSAPYSAGSFLYAATDALSGQPSGSICKVCRGEGWIGRGGHAALGAWWTTAKVSRR